MKTTFVAVVAFLAMIFSSFAQEKPAKITGAQISEAIATISAFAKDSAKVKKYCEMLALGAKADEALEKKDEKNAEQYGQQADAIAKTLGESFDKAMGIVSFVNPEEKSSESLFKAVDSLDASCGKG